MSFEVSGHWRDQWDPEERIYRRRWVETYTKGEPMAEPDFSKEATKLATKLNGEDAAQVYAVLALAQAVNNLADELRGMGTEAAPFVVQEGP